MAMPMCKREHVSPDMPIWLDFGGGALEQPVDQEALGVSFRTVAPEALGVCFRTVAREGDSCYDDADEDNVGSANTSHSKAGSSTTASSREFEPRFARCELNDVYPTPTSGQVDYVKLGGTLSAPQHVCTAPTWWRVVWCHERCMKESCLEKRQAITNSAHELGASLICLKKAAKFANWACHSPRPPFALLTDWREVKPCMEALEGLPRERRPAATMVLCENQLHFHRASVWARSLPPDSDPVLVCEDTGHPEHLVSLLREQADIATMREVYHDRWPFWNDTERAPPLARMSM